MKAYLYIIFVTLFFIITISCSHKRTEEHHEHHQNGGESWPQLDTFHTIMAKVFHPYKDSADLKPVKLYYAELQTAAEKWETEPLPEKVNDSTTKSMLKELTAEARGLSDKVKAGKDDEIGSSLSKLHDIFHKIMEAWYEEEHKNH